VVLNEVVGPFVMPLSSFRRRFALPPKPSLALAASPSIAMMSKMKPLLEEPVRSFSLPINWDWNESWNVGTETNLRSVKMPARTRQDRFKDLIE
jgi:hypothetical protein